MNKTITMNLSGIIFHVEEDAYEMLNKYLSTIKGYFNDSDGRDEIMSDIEARIAEMLQEKVNNTKQAILKMDVENVIALMGKPEEFAADSENTQQSNSESSQTEFSTADANYQRKRVFRDPDDKIIGGVCSGIANYFGFDPIWLRGIFAISFFIFGTGLLLYIILCIIIPKAKTTAEKLEMRGEKVDVNNISRAVNEEFDDFKKRMEKFGKDVGSKENRERVRTSTEKATDFIGDVLRNIFKFLGKIISVFVIVMSVILIVVLLGSLFGRNFIHVNTNDTEISYSIYDMMHSIFPNDLPLEFAVIGLVLFLGLPLLSMIYGGIRFLFGIKQKNKIVGYTTSILWFCGLAFIIYIVYQVSDDFKEDATSKHSIALTSIKSDTLYLSVAKLDKYGFNEDEEYDSRIVIDNWTLLKNNGKSISFGFPELDIVLNENDSIELVAIRTASGTDKKEALYRAKHIRYTINQKDSLLEFNPQFDIDMEDKWRNQNVKLILKIPANKVIFLSPSMKHIIYDIDNVSDTYDKEMLNRRWRMTNKGLECIDCDGLDNVYHTENRITLPPVPEIPEVK
jgi:phage shock protein PspC (stress-responsive transcriptional regulator)